MSSTASSRKDSLRTKTLCKNCQKPCPELSKCKTQNEISIQCDNCTGWFHKGCIKTNDKEWEFLHSSNANVLYKCEGCIRDKTKKVEETNELLRDELQGMNEKFQDLKRCMEANTANIISQLIPQIEASLLPKVEAMVDSKIQAHSEIVQAGFEERLKKLEEEKEQFKALNAQSANANDKFEERIQNLETKNVEIQAAAKAVPKVDDISIENKIKIQLTESIDELKEIEERKNNLIIFNVKETPSNDVEQSLEADLANVKEILSFSNPELINSQIKKLETSDITRMGLYKAGATKIRPIIVTLQNQKTKFQILKNSQKMKDCTTHTKIGFRMDLTKKQQKEDKALREELEERKKTEDVMIYKSKIILRSELEKHKAAHKAMQAEKNKPKDKEGNSTTNQA